ncbi:MAG TPA: enoyl-CoA hydratase/isomerase family protein [Nitriliruptorales bacterium]
MGAGDVNDFETISWTVAGGVGHLTLNRPDVHNAFNGQMLDEIQSVWRAARTDEDVRAIVLDAAGGKAFCTGIDRNAVLGDAADMQIGAVGGPFHFDDPGEWLGPKTNDLWKPVIAAVDGMAAGGAFYLLGECDIIICSDRATFFDPHVTYGMAAVFESIHLLQRVPLGEALRIQLTGAHERVTAETALRIGFVSEVVPVDELEVAAMRLATIIASQPAQAVQGTLRAVWAAQDLPRTAALDMAIPLIEAGNSPDALAAGQRAFESGERVEPRLR